MKALLTLALAAASTATMSIGEYPSEYRVRAVAASDNSVVLEGSADAGAVRSGFPITLENVQPQEEYSVTLELISNTGTTIGSSVSAGTFKAPPAPPQPTTTDYEVQLPVGFTVAFA